MIFQEKLKELLETVSEFRRNNTETDMTLEEIRNKLDFTQAEMSIIIDCSENSYNRWENLLRVPRSKYRRCMSELFGVNVLHSNMKAPKKKEEEQDETEGD